MRSGFVALGALIVAVGAIWLVDVTDTVDLDPGVWIALLLIATGVAVVATRGAGRGLLVTFGLVLVVAAVAITALDVSFTGGIGEETERPEAAADLDDPYDLGIGSLKLDLTDLEVDEDTTVRAQIGIGELRVTVPNGRAVSVDAELGAGDIEFFGEHEDGYGPQLEDERSGSGPSLRLELDGGVGSIKVVEP